MPRAKDEGIDFKLSQSEAEVISKLRQDISYSLSIIRAETFQSNLFADFFKGYGEDLTNLDRFLVYYQEVLTTPAIRKKGGGYFEFVSNVSKAMESFHSLSEKTSSSYERLAHIVTEVAIEDAEHYRKISLIRLKLVFAVLGLVYISLFLILVILRWLKFSRKKGSRLANTLEGFFVSTERFADYTKNRKLWGGALVLFGVCFWFILDTVNSAPEDLARIERFHARLKLTVVDNLRLSLFWVKFDSLSASSLEAAERLTETLEYIQTEPSTKHDKLGKDIIYLAILRGEISKQMGTIRGMTLQTADYNNYFGQIDENLKRYDEMVATIHKTHQSLVEGSITKKQMLEVINNLKMRSAFTALRESIKSSQIKLLSAINAFDIEEREYEAHRKAFIIRVFAIIPSTFYLLAFSFVGVRSWLKFRLRRN